MSEPRGALGLWLIHFVMVYQHVLAYSFLQLRIRWLIRINCNILQYRSVYFQKEADFKSKYLSNNNTTSGFTVEQVVSVVR